MFYLSINIGKNTHVTSLMNEKAKFIFEAHSFSNTSDGAATLLEKITHYMAALKIGMEATGHYWLFLYSFLAESHLVVHVTNPILFVFWIKYFQNTIMPFPISLAKHQKNYYHN